MLGLRSLVQPKRLRGPLVEAIVRDGSDDLPGEYLELAHLDIPRGEHLEEDEVCAALGVAGVPLDGLGGVPAGRHLLGVGGREVGGDAGAEFAGDASHEEKGMIHRPLKRWACRPM